MVAHFLALTLPITVSIPAIMDPKLFSWHPILMCFAYGMIMNEAIMLFSASSSLTPNAKRETKVQTHLVMMLICVGMALLGFAAIYVNKENYNKPHFMTWHAFCGVCLVGYTVMQVLAGLMLYNNKRFSSMLPKSFTLARWKLLHGLSGVICFAGACGVLLLGTYSAWYTEHVHEYVQGATAIGCVLLFALAMNHLSDMLQLQRRVMTQRQQRQAKS